LLLSILPLITGVALYSAYAVNGTVEITKMSNSNETIAIAHNFFLNFVIFALFLHHNKFFITVRKH
jgi:hypothetical protein